MLAPRKFSRRMLRNLKAVLVKIAQVIAVVERAVKAILERPIQKPQNLVLKLNLQAHQVQAGAVLVLRVEVEVEAIARARVVLRVEVEAIAKVVLRVEVITKAVHLVKTKKVVHLVKTKKVVPLVEIKKVVRIKVLNNTITIGICSICIKSGNYDTH